MITFYCLMLGLFLTFPRIAVLFLGINLYTSVYICIHLYTYVYRCIPVYTNVYRCIPMYTTVISKRKKMTYFGIHTNFLLHFLRFHQKRHMSFNLVYIGIQRYTDVYIGIPNQKTYVFLVEAQKRHTLVAWVIVCN